MQCLLQKKNKKQKLAKKFPMILKCTQMLEDENESVSRPQCGCKN
jgi:hypothetical protein